MTIKITKLFGLSLGILILALLLAIAHNNFGHSTYTRADLQTAFNKSVHWLQQNNPKLQSDHNSMLWWMLMQAEQSTNNASLNDIITQYKSANIQRYQSSAWSYLINETGSTSISPWSLGNLPDYNIHIIYGFSCSRSLAYEDIIKIQNKTNFCWRHHPISPACVTHQLMAFRFMQRTGCEEPQFVADSINILSGYIQQQSTYDFRVVDVYLQRVLMQLDSNNQNKINPRWIKRILNAQNIDGGWGDFQPLMPVGRGKYFGFTSKGIGIRVPESTFHATAQGVWLMRMLLQPATPTDIQP